MIIGLYNLEPNINNTAMMQVSRYHKDRGDQVEAYRHLMPARYDKVYAFSLFKFTPKNYVTSHMICGGTGFDVTTTLPPAIARCNLDYSIFPQCNTSYIWFSRGCIRQCTFCVVPQKEGRIRPVQPKNLNPRGEYITVMDNNFFANPQWQTAVNQLKKWGQPVDFQGIDVRILRDKHLHALTTLRHHKQIKMAWDNPHENLEPLFKHAKQIIPPHKIMVYVLIGFNSTPDEDLHRVETLRLIGFDPFVMPYDKFDEYQRHFARYVNNKAIFKSTDWAHYTRQKRQQRYHKQKR
jgi:hypothetical protein